MEAAEESSSEPAGSSDRSSSNHGSTNHRALALTVLLALPLLAMLGLAITDGLHRAGEGPLRAVLGNQRFDALMGGEGGTPHYLGYERVAPDVTFSTPDGGSWSLRDQRGKTVVLNFWSITCRPCIEEMPSLETLAQLSEERFGGEVEVVAVSTDGGWDDVSTVLPERPVLRHLFDPEKEVVEGVFGTQLYPETWIIDPEGVIRFRYDGARDWASALSLDLIDVFR